MNNRFSALLMIAATFTAGQVTTTPATAPSPAERSIAEARKEILEKPTQYAGYNLLAMALVRRAQETSDARYYTQAEDAFEKSLQLAPHNFDTEKIKVSILLGEHEFPAALDAAKALNKKVPDDVMVYGLLTEANVELGNYDDAENSAQWMLNLRPGNLPALTRAAHLRALFGDAEGAYELLDLAYQSTPPTEAGERAWLLTQMGHLRLASGDTTTAEKFLLQALTTFPDYPDALGNLAQLRIAQKCYGDAVAPAPATLSVRARAGNLYELAEALQLVGRADDAKRNFIEFETKSLLESRKKNNSNRELIFYYADHLRQPAEALQLAELEYSWRHDVYTLDAYAWALHLNGRDLEARKQIETALAVGVRDAKLLLHAGEIALKTGDRAAGERYLKQSADLNTLDSEQARSIWARPVPEPAR